MTADTPLPLVPRLRFPEFRSTGDYRFQPLSDIVAPNSERVGTSKCVPMSVTTGIGLLSQEEKFGRIIAGNSYKNYIQLQTNDFAYNKSATKEFPQGYIARYSGTRDAAVPNSIFTCFRPDADAVIPEYLDHLFHGNHHGRWLCKYITVGARAHGALSVSDDALMSMPIPLPPVEVSRPEQQKIADCLGSLDDLIVAEDRKLEALREHKQGLMQQLFPWPGENVPRLRFPEFRNAPDWSTLRGDTLFDSINNRRAAPGLPVLAVTQEHGAIPRDQTDYHVSVTAKSVASYKEVCEGDFIISLRSFQGGVEYSWYHGICSPAYMILRRKGGGNGHFFRHLFKSARFIQQLTRNIEGIRDGKMISYAQFSEQYLPVPEPPEQQKIADCLSSLDDLIATEDRKLEALRQHKQGLLQQLFPSLQAHWL